MRRAPRLAIASALTIGVALGVTACGPPPWEVGASSAPTTIDPSPTATTVIPTITPIVNDLAAGSAKRTLQAGAASLSVNYYSPLDLAKWTAGANKPLKVVLTATLPNDEGQGIYLSKTTVTSAVTGPSGSLPAPAPFVDQAVVGPGNSIKSPYSYELTYVIGALDPAATSITLSFAYDILTQTTPTSSEYAKSSAFDTLTVVIAPGK